MSAESPSPREGKVASATRSIRPRESSCVAEPLEPSGFSSFSPPGPAAPPSRSLSLPAHRSKSPAKSAVSALPDVAISGDGRFVVAWQVDGYWSSVFGQRYDRTGRRLGASLLLGGDARRSRQQSAQFGNGAGRRLRGGVAVHGLLTTGPKCARRASTPTAALGRSPCRSAPVGSVVPFNRRAFLSPSIRKRTSLWSGPISTPRCQVNASTPPALDSARSSASTATPPDARSIRRSPWTRKAVSW